MANQEVSSETITDIVQQERLDFNAKTEIDIVQLRTKDFEEIKSLKKIGGVYISKFEEMKDNTEARPADFKYFKYGLPIPNIDPEFKSLPEISEEMFPKAITSVENLMKVLDISENTQVSYEDYENR